MTERELHRRVVRLVEDAGVGLLATVDADGCPHARWMAAMPMDGIRRIITLTVRQTRKLEHLQSNPHVSWTFNDPDLEEIVQIRGRARISDDFLAAQAGWERLAASTRTYATGVLSDDEHLEMVLIETDVEAIELLSPSAGCRTAQPVPVTL